MPAKINTQKDLVKEAIGDRANSRLTMTTERIQVPGVKTLHLKPANEIAEVLANIIKSRNAISSLTFHVGDCIEVTSQSNLAVD